MEISLAKLVPTPDLLGELLRTLVFAPGEGRGGSDQFALNEGFEPLDPASAEGRRLLRWLSERDCDQEAAEFFAAFGTQPTLVGDGRIFAGWYADGDLTLGFDVTALLDEPGEVGLVSSDAKKTTRWRFVTPERAGLVSHVVPSADDPLEIHPERIGFYLLDPVYGLYNLALVVADEARQLRRCEEIKDLVEEVAEKALAWAGLPSSNRARIKSRLVDLGKRFRNLAKTFETTSDAQRLKKIAFLIESFGVSA